MLIKLHKSTNDDKKEQCNPENEIWINPDQVIFVEPAGAWTLVKFANSYRFVLEPKEIVVNLINTKETESHNKKMESQDDE